MHILATLLYKETRSRLLASRPEPLAGETARGRQNNVTWRIKNNKRKEGIYRLRLICSPHLPFWWMRKRRRWKQTDRLLLEWKTRREGGRGSGWCLNSLLLFHPSLLFLLFFFLPSSNLLPVPSFSHFSFSYFFYLSSIIFLPVTSLPFHSFVPPFLPSYDPLLLSRFISVLRNLSFFPPILLVFFFLSLTSLFLSFFPSSCKLSPAFLFFHPSFPQLFPSFNF